MQTSDADLFRFVPLPEYRAPAMPARTGARLRWHAMIKRLRGRSEERPRLVERESLKRLSSTQRDGIVCEQDPLALANAMASVLEPWLGAARPAEPVQVLVHAPHCATPSALRRWARDASWEVVEAPPRARILEEGAGWIDRLRENQDGNLAIPSLEAFFLRHFDGFDLVRALSDWMLSRPGRSVVACSSWTWAFLDKALGLGSAFPTPFTLAPFGGRELGAWFQALQQTGQDGEVVFRSAVDGSSLFPPGDGEGEGAKAEDDPDPHPFFLHLAGGSRGIAGVAAAIWCHGLRIARENGAATEASSKVAEDPRRTVWVTGWTDLGLPLVSSGLRQSHRFMLHALLIHGSLTVAELEHVLPSAQVHLRQGVGYLSAQGLIEPLGDGWRVAPIAFPAVRQALADEEFLLDAL